MTNNDFFTSLAPFVYVRLTSHCRNNTSNSNNSILIIKKQCSNPDVKIDKHCVKTMLKTSSEPSLAILYEYLPPIVQTDRRTDERTKVKGAM